MALKDKIKALEICVLGNRVNALSTVLFLSGLNIAYRQMDVNFFDSMQGLTLSAISVLMASGTFFGHPTYRAYKSAKHSIRAWGSFDSALLDFGKSIDYCVLQGAYLAAKEEGLGDDFKQKKHNIFLF